MELKILSSEKKTLKRFDGKDGIFDKCSIKPYKCQNISKKFTFLKVKPAKTRALRVNFFLLNQPFLIISSCSTFPQIHSQQSIKKLHKISHATSSPSPGLFTIKYFPHSALRSTNKSEKPQTFNLYLSFITFTFGSFNYVFSLSLSMNYLLKRNPPTQKKKYKK